MAKRFTHHSSFILLTFLLSIFSCAPKIIVKTSQVLPAAPDSENIIIIAEDDATDLSQEQVLGEIIIKDNGFSVGCTYDKVLDMARREAKQVGANVLKIDEHLTPDYFSTCHRIKARALRVKHVSSFEKEIVWQNNRKLVIDDFKGSTENRPHQASTAAYIRYKWSKEPLSKKLELVVETVFDCQKSYFKDSSDLDMVLEHEQGHFDLSEIYARKLLQQSQAEIHTIEDIEKVHNKIYNQIITELNVEQDKYDADIYPDHSKQALWISKINAALKASSQFESKKIVILLN